MAGSATNYLETAVLGHTLAFSAYTKPGAVYVGLCTTAPTAAAAGTEVTGGGYVRRQATMAMDSGGRPDLAANAVTIEWLPATGTWGTVGWFELWDAATLGNRLYWGELVDPADFVTPITRTVLATDIMRLQAGALRVQAI